MRAGEAAERVLAALARGEPRSSVVVVESTLPGVRPGARIVVGVDAVEGTLGEPTLDAHAVALARAVLEAGRAGTHPVEVEGGRCALYVEPHRPPDELVIVGAGHLARPLCTLGAMLGYGVVVLDDRPEFATPDRFPEAARVVRADFADPFAGVTIGPATHLVLVTRGHKYDFEALRDLLRRPVEPAYVGMVGSQRRVRAALEQLAREGVPLERLRRVHAPIGLDIGAETPEEIAVAIAAELIRVRRGGTGESLRERARVVERWLQGPG